MMSSKEKIKQQNLAIKKSLSELRLSTYEKQTNNLEQALELYHWNSEISSAFFAVIAHCEVTLRNAISEAISLSVFGDDWVRNEAFAGSFPVQVRQTLHKLATNKKIKKQDQAIAGLTFGFWQKVLTARFDEHIWQDNLFVVMPNLPVSDVALARQTLYQEMEQVRVLRNRIAHHETITKRNLKDDFSVIIRLINYRCQDTAYWVQDNQTITHLLTKRPPIKSKK